MRKFYAFIPALISFICLVALIVLHVLIQNGIVNLNNFSKPRHYHNYTEFVAEHKVSEATCQSPAVFLKIYKCKCGLITSRYKNVGEPLNHDLSAISLKNNRHESTCLGECGYYSKELCTFENGICTVCLGEEVPQVLEYRLINGGTEYEVVGIGSVTSPDIVIPRTYNGKVVTSIGLGAFKFDETIKSIKISKYVKNIETRAFFLSSLESVSIEVGSQLESIRYQAFFWCKGSPKQEELPSGIKIIEREAFGYDNPKKTIINK